MPKNKVLKGGVMSFRTELEELALILLRHSNQRHSRVCPLLLSSVDTRALKAGSALCRVLGQHSLGEAGPGLEVRYVALELIQSPSEGLKVKLC